MRKTVLKADGWVNTATGLGDDLRDRVQRTRFFTGARLSDASLDALYHDNDIAAKIVDGLPTEALRPGFEIDLGADTSDDFKAKMHDKLKALNARAAFEDAGVWGRLFGGAVILIGARDGQDDQSQPLNIDALESIDSLFVLDKRDILPYTFYGAGNVGQYLGQFNSTEVLQKIGMPETYSLAGACLGAHGGELSGKNGLVHESRLIRFDGAKTSRQRRFSQSGWCDSVLQRVHDVLRSFGVAWQAVGSLLTESSVGVFKIQGLIDMINSGDKDVLRTRMEVVDMGKSVARSIMLDAEQEDYSRVSYSYAGLPDILQAFMLRVAAAANMPVSILMGQAPAGLNATGESDHRAWYNAVTAYQQYTLVPKLERLVSLVFRSAEMGGRELKGWNVKFNALWEPTDKEQAEIEYIHAQKDKILIDGLVALPEEIALSRYPSTGFSPFTKLDLEARQRMAEAEMALAEEQAGNTPEPVPAPGIVSSADESDDGA